MTTDMPEPMKRLPGVPERLAALAIVFVALGSLRWQFDVALLGPEGGTPGRTLWRMAGYFTVLTNLLVALLMAGVASRLSPGPRLSAAVVLSAGMVAVLYHLVLAQLWQPQGRAWWADQGLHTAVPICTLGWWLAFAPKRLGWRDLPFMLIWPGTYVAYAMARGAATGFWPYPFLDADKIGWATVAGHVALLIFTFVLAGLGLIALARRSVR